MQTTEILILSQLIISSLGVAVTACGFVLAIRQLQSEYRWRRQQYAVNMLAEWNAHTAEHREGIEEAFPGLLDTIGPCANVDLDEQTAGAIYAAKKGDAYWEVKCHMIELLNYCEYIAVSYKRNVGDSDILEQSFQTTLSRWHKELGPFIRAVVAHRGYDPWQPFSDFIRELAGRKAETGLSGPARERPGAAA